jgi:hypothetical protein
VPHAASDGLLALLHPAWQAVIGICLVLVFLVGLWRMAMRGASRMTNGVIVSGLLIVALTVITALASQLR